MTDILIGLDVGTTATKAVAFDLAGIARAEASSGYGLLTPGHGWVEQDPEALWRAVVEVLRAVAGQLGPDDRVVALAQSSQGGTTIPVDAAGAPLGNAISWMDTRAAAQADAVRAQVDAEFIRTTTGWPLQAALPLQHIGWLRDNCPQLHTGARHYLFVNDFIGRRLTGRLCMNPSDASITQLMNLATGDWDERLLEMAGIRRAQLAPIRPSGAAIGALTLEAAEATGLPADALVVNGAHDQYCVAVGTGVTQPGRMLLSCGTAWVLLAVPENLALGLASGMAISRHAIEGRWGAIRSLGGVGTSLEWLVNNTYGLPSASGTGANTGPERERLYIDLNEAAGRCPPGADGLLFLPLAGGHATGFGPARGGFMNLSLNHGRGHLARAIMEGTAFELRWAVEEMRAANVKVAELTMVGGAAKSSLWPEIVADVLGLPVTVPAMKDAAARGAAILAGVGAGPLHDAETALAAWKGEETCLQPEPRRQHLLDAAYARYQALARMQKVCENG
jgi:sugar (pentulose or hexulose) kinase